MPHADAPPARPGPLERAGERLRDARLRATYAALLWLDRARAGLRLRRGFHAGGVYYKELAPERLARALSRRGTGHKDFRVTFPDGHKQVVRVEHSRCYADLTGPEGIARYVHLAPSVRPGSRVLEVAAPPACTGYTADYLGALVGPSGAVVSLVADEEGARFAPRRYGRNNVGVEHLPAPTPLTEALAGETDGAFDGAVAFGCGPDDGPALRELWRVVAPGGWLALGGAGASVDVGLCPPPAAAGPPPPPEHGLTLLRKPHGADPRPPAQ